MQNIVVEQKKLKFQEHSVGVFVINTSVYSIASMLFFSLIHHTTSISSSWRH